MTRLILAVSLVLATPLAGQTEVSAERIARHVGVLAHDSLRGRATPSPGLESAAAYVARELERAGIRPVGRALVDRWPMVTRTRLTEGARPSVAGAPSARLTYGRDFAVMAAGVPELRGRLVPVASLADTAGVRGNIPLLRVAGAEWGGPAHAALREGRRAGARAVVLVLDSVDAMGPVAEAAIAMDHAATGVPAVLLTRDAAARLTGGGSREITVRIPERVDTTSAPWVLGVLPGRDLAAEHVVVSAHLDHLGVGAPDERGDSIYNGADDNASGVAALLEIARALAGSATAPRRSVLFFVTSAEEVCICASERFTREPPVPLESIVADVNLDGIGRSWQDDTVSAEGSAYSSLGRTVRAVAQRHPELRLTVVDDQWPDRSYFLTSDQIWFARRGVPSIFLSSTGPDRHYHRPSDEPGTIEPEVTARIAGLAAWLVRDVADASERPVWDPAARATLRVP